MALAPLPENFRSEMARFQVNRVSIATIIKMNPSVLSGYLTGTRPLTGWAAHNIGFGINVATGRRLIDVDMNRGLVKAKPGRRLGMRFPQGYAVGFEEARRRPRKDHFGRPSK